jgi:hypothetical protein
MNNLGRIARYGAILGFLFVSSGCVVAPDHGYDHERSHESDRDHDGDRGHGDHHCDDHDERCRDR